MIDIDLSKSSFLQRYPSEWDPRHPGKTKGGYMQGRIGGVPEQARSMVLQTVPDEKYSIMMKSDEELNQFPSEVVSSAHPLLLHVVRMGRGKRDNELEPVPNLKHWKQEFVIDRQRRVRIINKTSELDYMRNVPVCLDDPRNIVTTIRDQNCIVLGGKKNELNLIALQPKTEGRATPEEASVTKVLKDRLNTDNSDLIKVVEGYFKKENSSNLKMFRLRADFFNEFGQHIGMATSETVKDTGNKKNGSMDIHDISVQRSCTKGGRKVIIDSEYSLAKDVRPIFQVHDEYGNHCEHDDWKLNQPTQPKVRNSSIHIITPPQPEKVIHELILSRKHIVIRFKRDSDQYESPLYFPFTYDLHPEKWCIFCELYPDTVAEGEAPRLHSGLENPKPRKIKRVLTENGKVRAAKVSRLTSDSSPEYGDLSLEQTVPKMSPPSSGSYCNSPEHEFHPVEQKDLKMSPASFKSYCNSPEYEFHPVEQNDLKMSPPSSLLSSPVYQDPQEELSELSSLESFMNNYGLCDVANMESDEVPTTLMENETLNTPNPIMDDPFSFQASFPSMRPRPETLFFKSSPVNLELRGDIVRDCAVQQRNAIETVETRPTQRVEPMKRNETENSIREEDSEEEEEEEKENTLLRNFPFLVLVLILLVILTSHLGPACAGMFTLLCVGLSAVYQFSRDQLQTPQDI